MQYNMMIRIVVINFMPCSEAIRPRAGLVARSGSVVLRREIPMIGAH